MKRLKAWFSRIAGLTQREQRERALAAEIDSHIAMHVEDKMRAGLTAEQARRDAILQLGGLESTKQAYRDRSTIPFLEALVRDLRFALRQLRKNRGFALIAILMLALSICANVAIFSFVDAVLMKPLPYRSPARLVSLYESNALGSQYHLSYPDYLDWKNLNRVFQSLDVYEADGFILSTPNGAERAEGVRVSDGFFRTLGVSPFLGRDFRPGEDLASAPDTVLLSYAGWQRRYGGRADVIGKTVTLDGVSNTIIGVLPRDFHFSPGEPADFWATLHTSGQPLTCRGCHNLFGIARLRDGISVSTSVAAMKSIAAALESKYPDSNRSRSATVLLLTEVIVGDVRPILLALPGGAALLLVIVCVNVCSLLLVRSENRKREIAIRSALGASSARLIFQSVTEGMLLSFAGSALGVAAAYEAMRLVIQLIPPDMMASMTYLQGVKLNLHVCLFAVALSLFAGLLFSLTPILRLPRSRIPEGLAERSRGSAGTVWHRFGRYLVIVELALALVLLVSAGLLGKSLYRLLHIDIGLEPDHLATLQIGAHGDRYAKPEAVASLEQQINDRFARLPGVESAAVSDGLPLGDGDGIKQFQVVGKPILREHNEANDRSVSASYFATLRARLIRGRQFAENENMSQPLVAIINRTLEKQYFPAEDPIGKQILKDGPPAITIVGIVDDLQEGPLDMKIRPAMYLPFGQATNNDFAVVVRTSLAEESLLPGMAQAIHEIDPGIVTFAARTMSDRINQSPSAWLHRCSAWLVGAFAGLALLLGVVGLYGVISYSVSQRTREIGVRIALGAQRREVYRLILREAGGLVAVGIIAGLLCSVAATSVIGKLLFGVRSWDPPTVGLVAAVLAAAALLASYIPARRAALVDPAEALRAE
jgi:macrolide transport system ATP-binding/permease protein